MSLILDLLFPKFCLQCKKTGSYFCSDCLNNQIINSPHIPQNNQNYEGSLSLFKYNSLIKKIITEIKYGFVTDIVDPFVDTSVSLLKTNFPHILDYWRQNDFTIIPIPLHYFRQNWRGFNQSILIGKSLASKLDLKFSDQVLFRSKNTHVQAKLDSKKDKRLNVDNAFICAKTVPKNIIIFDDVATTFSTLKSALKTISSYGDPTHCWFLTLAGR
jgi:ComF family protein